MKKQLSLVLAVAMAFSLLAGCSGGGTEPSSSTTPPPESTAPGSATPTAEIIGDNLKYDPNQPVNNCE